MAPRRSKNLFDLVSELRDVAERQAAVRAASRPQLAQLADTMSRQITAGIAEEDRLASTLDLARFCDKECRQSYAADLRTGVVAGLTDDTEFCEYCGMRLSEMESAP